MKIIIFDTETNGLRGSSCLEFYALKVFLDEKEEIYDQEEFHRFYYPHEGKYNYYACRVHGLDEYAITEKRDGGEYPRFFKDDLEVQDFFNDVDVIVGHNVNFDMQYIDTVYFQKDVCVFCTMKNNKNIIKVKGKRGIKNPKLIEAAEFYELYHTEDDFHGAKYDVDITTQIFFKMIERGYVKVQHLKSKIQKGTWFF